MPEPLSMYQGLLLGSSPATSQSESSLTWVPELSPRETKGASAAAMHPRQGSCGRACRQAPLSKASWLCRNCRDKEAVGAAATPGSHGLRSKAPNYIAAPARQAPARHRASAGNLPLPRSPLLPSRPRPWRRELRPGGLSTYRRAPNNCPKVSRCAKPLIPPWLCTATALLLLASGARCATIKVGCFSPLYEKGSIQEVDIIGGENNEQPAPGDATPRNRRLR